MDWFLTFANGHPFLAFVVIWFVYCVTTLPFRLVNRWIRHRNIKVAGWPPPHLDADGDAVEEDSA